MRVLVSAYACDPARGSEHGAGWTWAKAIAENNETWVLTRATRRPEIEAALALEPDLAIHFVYLDLPARLRKWKRGQRAVHVYYFLWQVLAWRTARRLHREVDFDVAHHLTFAIDWMPAGVAWVKGLQTVWGPVGGTTNTPLRLWRWLGVRGWCSEFLKEATCRPARRLFGDATARRAALVVAQNDDVAARFSSSRALVVEPNVALDPSIAPAGNATAQDNRSAPSPRVAGRAIFAGRLVPLKGLRLALAAMADPGADGWILDVYGEGPERRGGARCVRRLRLGDRVHFYGALPREELLKRLSTADVLLFPSFHDSASWVVGEALSVGCPVLCLDLAGSPNLVGATGGRAISHTVSDLPGKLARSLAEVSALSPNRDRWSAARLPHLVDTWYSIAVGERSSVA